VRNLGGGQYEKMETKFIKIRDYFIFLLESEASLRASYKRILLFRPIGYSQALLRDQNNLMKDFIS
jgi:hypothetical protein